MRRLASLLLVALVISPAPRAFAQDARGSGGGLLALRQQLKGGDRVTVHLDDGATVAGTFVTVSDADLTMVTGGVRRVIPASQIARVQRRRNGVLLGTIIGAAAGVPFGLALRSYAHNEGGNQAGALLFPIGVGAGAGLAIDAALAIDRTVYVR